METIYVKRVRVEVTDDNNIGQHITVRCLDEIDFEDGLGLRIRVIRPHSIRGDRLKASDRDE